MMVVRLILLRHVIISLLLLFGVGASFSPSLLLSSSTSPTISRVRRTNPIQSTPIYAAKKAIQNNRRYGNTYSKQQQIRANNNSSRQKTTPKRVPQNKRTAIRWVIQGVERCLAVVENEEDTNEALAVADNYNDNRHDGNTKSYKRRIDASLVDALYLMVNASTQKDILEAEKRIQVLMKYPTDFPMEVNERVIKATAMAGLGTLSLKLLMNMLNNEKIHVMPSSMAYTAVLNCLRKNGRVDRLEDTLSELAKSCRTITRKTGNDNVGVDLVVSRDLSLVVSCFILMCT